MHIGQRTRHAQHFDDDGSWIRGHWRVINGVPYKFSKVLTADGDTLLMAMSLTGRNSHILVFEKDDNG